LVSFSGTPIIHMFELLCISSKAIIFSHTLLIFYFFLLLISFFKMNIW
jgi:hypothetical protein